MSHDFVLGDQVLVLVLSLVILLLVFFAGLSLLFVKTILLRNFESTTEAGTILHKCKHHGQQPRKVDVSSSLPF